MSSFSLEFMCVELFQNPFLSFTVFEVVISSPHPLQTQTKADGNDNIYLFLFFSMATGEYCPIDPFPSCQWENVQICVKQLIITVLINLVKYLKFSKHGRPLIVFLYLCRNNIFHPLCRGLMSKRSGGRRFEGSAGQVDGWPTAAVKEAKTTSEEDGSEAGENMTSAGQEDVNYR